MSRVCSIHEEFCPEDTCRWCDPPPAKPDGFVVLDVNQAEGMVTFGPAPVGLEVIAPPANYWAGWPTATQPPEPSKIAQRLHVVNRILEAGRITHAEALELLIWPMEHWPDDYLKKAAT